MYGFSKQGSKGVGEAMPPLPLQTRGPKHWSLVAAAKMAILTVPGFSALGS